MTDEEKALKAAAPPTVAFPQPLPEPHHTEKKEPKDLPVELQSAAIHLRRSSTTRIQETCLQKKNWSEDGPEPLLITT